MGSRGIAVTGKCICVARGMACSRSNNQGGCGDGGTSDSRGAPPSAGRASPSAGWASSSAGRTSSRSTEPTSGASAAGSSIAGCVAVASCACGGRD